MSTVEARALAILSVVNILVNTSQVGRCLLVSLVQQLRCMDTLQDNLIAQENYVVDYLNGLEELQAGPLSELSPFPSQEVMITLRAFAAKTKLLHALRTQIIAWRTLRIEQRQLLNSYDLEEYFAHRNNEAAFKARDQAIRVGIGYGDVFMISKKTGRVITSCAEATMFLLEYPGFLIRRRVKTIQMPTYNGIDLNGRMEDTGDHRCLIETLTYDEMVTRCNERNQLIPDGVGPQDLNALAAEQVTNESGPDGVGPQDLNVLAAVQVTNESGPDEFHSSASKRSRLQY